MKKFEEELKIIPVMGREPIRNQALYSKCDIVELSNDWVSPDDHQKVVEDLTNARSSITNLMAQLDYYKKDKRFEAMAEEILSLKYQLEKQQPEIPYFVAEYARDCERELSYVLEEIYMETDYLEDHSTRNEREDLIARYWLYNRTVAKEKRFYLKNKLTTSYLELDKTNDYFQHTMNPAPYTDMTRKSQFTQQEIDSMETGSYEQIEVEA
ncbi:DUF1642 domain-containing protein [Lactococcus petauri]|uniref:DUF1642 domain-containing protein n=1 Tax=Lactococcus petauri TaxID=1940789 RepID=UPI0038526CD9